MTTPQEEIAAIRGACVPKSRTPEENKALCEKYPFLTWYGDPLYAGYDESSELDYDYTWEDEVPEGWRSAFCPQMWDELKAILEKADYVNEFRFAQIKEKYGELRLYWCGAPNEIYDEVSAWEEKYMDLSVRTCIHCGKPAEYMTTGWITYVCEDCAKKSNDACIDVKDIESYYDAPRDERKKFFKDF